MYRFLIVDDHPIYLSGFKKVLAKIYPDSTIRCAKNSEDAISLLKKGEYDIAFLDIDLNESVNGIELIEKYSDEIQRKKLVVVSANLDAALVAHLKQLNIAGATSKQIDTRELGHLCSVILDGEPYFTEVPTLSSSLTFLKDEYRDFHLTKAEKNVLVELKSGAPNKLIASNLAISENTLRAHLRNIFGKMNVSTRTECVAKAIDNRLV